MKSSFQDIGRKTAIRSVLLFALVSPVAAQEDSARSPVGNEPVTSRATSVNVYPFAYYNPELKLAFGYCQHFSEQHLAMVEKY